MTVMTLGFAEVDQATPEYVVPKSIPMTREPLVLAAFTRARDWSLGRKSSILTFERTSRLGVNFKRGRDFLCFLHGKGDLAKPNPTLETWRKGKEGEHGKVLGLDLPSLGL